MNKPILIGWRERASLPGLGIKDLRIKVDTGAKTSSLHAVDIQAFENNGQQWLRFMTQSKRNGKRIACQAPLIEMRSVTNSGGQSKLRPVILTQIKMAGLSWEIELTLADRSNMKFSMLLGRHAMSGKFIVHPAQSYMLKPRARNKKP